MLQHHHQESGVGRVKEAKRTWHPCMISTTVLLLTGDDKVRGWSRKEEKRDWRKEKMKKKKEWIRRRRNEQIGKGGWEEDKRRERDSWQGEEELWRAGCALLYIRVCRPECTKDRERELKWMRAINEVGRQWIEDRVESFSVHWEMISLLILSDVACLRYGSLKYSGFTGRLKQRVMELGF